MNSWLNGGIGEHFYPPIGLTWILEILDFIQRHFGRRKTFGELFLLFEETEREMQTLREKGFKFPSYKIENSSISKEIPPSGMKSLGRKGET